jgi:hypothetical protein
MIQQLVSSAATSPCARRIALLLAAIQLLFVCSLAQAQSMASALNIDNVRPTVITTDGKSCAIRDDRQVMCWGYRTKNAEVPSKVGISDAITLATNGDAVCAVLTSGNVKCAIKDKVVSVPKLDDAVSVAVGTRHACVVRENGAVVCWGENVNNSLGDASGESRGTLMQPESPVAVRHAGGSLSVVSNGDITCSVRTSGGVRCWGSTYLTGTQAYINMPDARVLVLGNNNEMCVLRSKGAVACQNLSNGLDIENDSLVKNMTSVDAIAGSGGVLCASTPKWRCAHTDFNEVAGAGFMTKLPVDAAQLVMGFAHSCASLSDGSLQCMHHGYNYICDIGAQGAKCHDDRWNTINRYGELGVPAAEATELGAWYTIPKFTALEPTAPSDLFGSPNNLSASNPSNGKLVVQWDEEPYASSYVVRYKDDGPDDWIYVDSSQIDSGSTPQATITGLRAGHSYYVSVRARYWGGGGRYATKTFAVNN